MRIFVVLLVVFLSAYNNVLNVVDRDYIYVPVNLAVAVALVVAARSVGVTTRELGLAREGVKKGMVWGGAILGLVALGLLLAYIVPFLHVLLGDRRAAMGGGMLAYHALIRIPLGTVVLEEVAFRGVLLGAWSHVARLRTAVVGTCAVFGVWHAVPALDLVRVNQLASGFWAQAALVAAAVALTGASSVILVGLRLLTNGIWGPAVVHAGTNSLALVVAFWAQR